jgi:HD-GYP domain-containing protein (c-di-GMP phosphodiesterase class II)
MAERAPRRRGRILTSLLVLLFVVGVVPLLLTSWNLISRSRESLEFTQRSIQQDKAQALSREVAMYVQGLTRQVVVIARTLEVEGAGSKAKIPDTHALERYVGENSPLLFVSVVDASGRGASAGYDLQEPPIRRWLEEGYERGRHGSPMVGHPIVSQAMKEPVLILAEPIHREKNRADGVVLAVASLLPLWQLTQQAGRAGTFEVYVVDAGGRLVAHSAEAQPLGVEFAEVPIVAGFLKDPRGVGAVTTSFALSGEDGKTRRMLGTYTRVPDDSGWGVFVQVEEEKAYLSVREMLRQSVFVVAAAMCLAVLAGTLFAGQVSRPIRLLAQGAYRMAQGDYSARVAVNSRNEVGVLADAFNQMGEEIERAIEEIRRAAATNRELFIGSIRMLANAIDEKDPYTRGHSERVAYYSMVTARHMGMSAEEVDRVHLSGIIHDVGKIGIEDKILRKASALTDDEYAIMKQHPRKGLHILGAVPLLKDLAGAGLMHHENWDGSGYPEGLSGEDIPLLGRIVCVADAFDAMTTDRPYSKAMTFEAAVERLRFLKGKKFDAAIVDAFARAAEAGDITPAKARLAAVAARSPDDPGDVQTPAPAERTEAPA